MTSTARSRNLAVLGLAACALGATLGACGDTGTTAGVRPAGAAQASVESRIAVLLSTPSDVSDVYRLRGHRPIWTDATRRRLADILERAGDDGLDPRRYDAAGLRSLVGHPARAAEADIASSRAWIAYLQDLRGTPAAVQMTYVDAALAPETRPSAVLAAAATAPSLAAHMGQARRMHPLYERLRAALSAYRVEGRVASGLSGQEYERRLLANMARLRALPANPAARYILVDAASARLWMYEDGDPTDTMRVVVGKASQQTPMLAGLIRYAVRSPYWNLPPDLIRVRASQVLREGTVALERQQLELLSGWGADARVLDPSEVDWAGVAAGTQRLRMRQLPGPDNMMGQVKFMLPNRLGIYLHDTPNRAVFAGDDRALSSGCVRVEDADRLHRWLAEGREQTSSGMPEERVDLATPVPVYILYLTAMPEASGIILQDDPYGRDGRLPHPRVTTIDAASPIRWSRTKQYSSVSTRPPNFSFNRR